MSKAGWWYYMTQRPPAPGAMPRRGLIESHDFGERLYVESIGRKVWGSLVYDRPLTEEEIDDYELVPMNNDEMTPLYPGNGFFMNGQSFVYEKYENGNCILWYRKKDKTFVYGYEGLKRMLKQHGLELMKEEENGYEI